MGLNMNGREPTVHSKISRENDLNNMDNKYTTLNENETEVPTGYGRNWIPGPTGFEPKDLNPPRYEFKELHEHVLTMEYKEQENCTAVASKFTRTYGHRFWGEFFSLLMPIFDFVFALILELLSFLLRLVSQVLFGIIFRISDLLIKPALVYYFNSCTIPCLTWTHNILRAVVRAISPVLDLAERVAHIFAIPLKALRLIEISKTVTKGKPFDA